MIRALHAILIVKCFALEFLSKEGTINLSNENVDDLIAIPNTKYNAFKKY